MRTLILVAVLSVSAMGSNEVTKTPYEAIDISMDFAARAPSGITFDSATAVTAYGHKDSTAAIIETVPAPAVVPASERVVVRLKAGVEGETYLVSIRAVKSDTGEKLEGNVLLHVVAYAQ